MQLLAVRIFSLRAILRGGANQHRGGSRLHSAASPARRPAPRREAKSGNKKAPEFLNVKVVSRFHCC
jgi:hypothetical protein